MKPKLIDNLDHWENAEQYLRVNGYKRWCTQHFYFSEEFRTWFWKLDSFGDKKEIELYTIDKVVQDAMIEFEV